LCLQFCGIVTEAMAICPKKKFPDGAVD